MTKKIASRKKSMTKFRRKSFSKLQELRKKRFGLEWKTHLKDSKINEWNASSKIILHFFEINQILEPLKRSALQKFIKTGRNYFYGRRELKNCDFKLYFLEQLYRQLGWECFFCEINGNYFLLCRLGSFWGGKIK